LAWESVELVTQKKKDVDEQMKKALEQGHTIDITTTGRKSGLPRRIEISFQNLDGHLYILGGQPGPRDRLANLKANPDFTFHLKGQVQADLPAQARVIDDEAERREIFYKLTSASGTELEARVKGSPLAEVVIKADG
jgi:deazaflavin-dependent oxidoreductase (nitroreductase family)